MPKTWEDVNDLINVTTEHRSVDMKELEDAFKEGNVTNQKILIKTLRESTGTYSADIYPLGGLRLDLETQRKRLMNHYKNSPQDLINEIYTKAKKIKKLKEEGVGLIVTEKKPEKKPCNLENPKPIKIPKKEIKDDIKFKYLKPDENLAHFVPAIDNNYEFPIFTKDCANFLDHGLNIWLYGGTGAGKSSLIEQICAIGNIPLMYCSFHEDVKPDQLFGGFRLVDGNTVWQDGPVTKAYREGMVLLLDEIDGLPPEISFSLYAITDHKPLVLAENNNEIIKPHPNFRVVATGNTHGRGDESGMYSGTNVLNRAFLNRFRVWYEVKYPSKTTYKKIMMGEGISNQTASTIATLAHEINKAFSNGIVTETFSLRDAREVAKITEILDGNVKDAIKVTLMNRLSSIEQGAVNEMFRRLVK